MNSETERIDKFLWAVRLYKTRSKASEACKSKHVLVNEMPVKSSRTIKEGDTFKIRFNPIYREFQVIKVLKNRVGAKLVENYITEITAKIEQEKLEISTQSVQLKREKGTGRPTKKDRRDLSDFFE